jgi:ribA/ribD-fused uncharacterized protein
MSLVPAILEFQGENRWLSNFWKTPVHFEGILYPSSEHAYQAAKHLDVATKKKIAKMTPGQAKRAGGRGFPDWENQKVIVMEKILRIKFQNPAMKKKLLSTGDAILEEGNTWGDKFWGVSPPGSGNGNNILGHLLMKIREDLKAEELEKEMTEPPKTIWDNITWPTQ